MTEGARTKERPKRVVQLDVLRGVAILLVIGHHYVIKPEDAGVFSGLAAWLVAFGWTGVDLFFVLSGFLIGGLLFAEIQSTGELDVRRFLIRRGFKIWPSYFLFIAAVYWVLWKQTGKPFGALTSLLPNLLHIQNYLGTPRTHTWTLAVEEHFYLLLPLVLGAVINRPGAARSKALSHFPAVVLAVCAACAAFRCYNLTYAFKSETHFYATHVRIDSLLFGVLLAYLSRYRPEAVAGLVRRRWVLFAAGILLQLPMYFIKESHPFVWTAGFTLLYLSYGALLLAFVPAGNEVAPKGDAPMPLAWLQALLAFVGYYSYTVYLWHMDIARFPLWKLVETNTTLTSMDPSLRWIVVNCAYLVLSLVFGVIAARMVEQPALRFRDRVFPRKAKPSVQV